MTDEVEMLRHELFKERQKRLREKAATYRDDLHNRLVTNLGTRKADQIVFELNAFVLALLDSELHSRKGP